MKIFILHGEHTQNSYNRLQEYIKKAKDKGWEINYIEKKDNNVSDIFLGKSLFDKERLLIITDLRILDVRLTRWLKKNSNRLECYLIIYHQGAIAKSFIKFLPAPEKIENYELPKLIWNFLDSFFPGNAKNSYKLFHEVVKKEPVEFVFSMLTRQVRDIYWAKVDPKTMEYPEWRVGKFKRLASKYSIEELENLIEEMSVADINSKTSQADLSKSLDFLITKYLE